MLFARIQSLKKANKRDNSMRKHCNKFVQLLSFLFRAIQTFLFYQQKKKKKKKAKTGQKISSNDSGVTFSWPRCLKSRTSKRENNRQWKKWKNKSKNHFIILNWISVFALSAYVHHILLTCYSSLFEHELKIMLGLHQPLFVFLFLISDSFKLFFSWIFFFAVSFNDFA